ncbi:enoyl-CoA hydratase/isomerase family protein [Acinetobacter baumannii]|uniref:enoyl-CoA hydratase/isomerase family protein n=1 Tax=Acinetobacter baumannii TaxID=470 RepID=UPI001900E5AA|nr:enoyl-CoA hydratase/isomerase family protein [Acinetobacter baumannii]MBJ9493366.1 enoyl-CoA hydratase/isomerase family protein [Acinetobacter baumannii]MCT9183637.1 enoyl-CoA hydratase/isomerase family protein [Acinetobacter baumannii]MCT9224275.1 enoyl-CoA hydratase/isomerase family protein [Acinetobacter baumannii]MCT9276144.1 enoyl-CoA hydratase/isomerase family protein [Acinetobacter baumannii]
MSTSQGLVTIRFENSVAIVQLDRPDKLNALTPEMINQLEDIAKSLDQRTDLKAVILTASGDRAFCVGADIKVWAALEPIDMWRSWTRNGHRVFDSWARLRLPVIAAINGHAFGGGLELLAAADIRVTDPHATFALPEAGIATCPGWSGTQRLVNLIGSSQVKYLAMTGRRISAEQALKVGLVQEISEIGDVLSSAMRIAEEISAKAPISIQLIKQLIDAGEGHNLAAVLEGIAGALAATTEDAKEGLASFSERRTAQYKGK